MGLAYSLMLKLQEYEKNKQDKVFNRFKEAYKKDYMTKRMNAPNSGESLYNMSLPDIDAMQEELNTMHEKHVREEAELQYLITQAKHVEPDKPVKVVRQKSKVVKHGQRKVRAKRHR